MRSASDGRGRSARNGRRVAMGLELYATLVGPLFTSGHYHSHREVLMFGMSSAGRHARAVALLLVCAFGPVGIVSAQSVTGSIQGTIVDQSGAVLPGVTVNVTNTATGVART